MLVYLIQNLVQLAQGGEPVVNTTQICPMSYLRKQCQKKHAAYAHKGRLQQELASTAIESQVDVVMSPPQIGLTLDDETNSNSQCDGDGTINNNYFESDSDSDFIFFGKKASASESNGFSEFDNNKLLQIALNDKAALLLKTTLYQDQEIQVSLMHF